MPSLVIQEFDQFGSPRAIDSGMAEFSITVSYAVVTLFFGASWEEWKVRLHATVELLSRWTMTISVVKALKIKVVCMRVNQIPFLGYLDAVYEWCVYLIFNTCYPFAWTVPA